MQVDTLTIKNITSWICSCGASNNDKNTNCTSCKEQRFDSRYKASRFKNRNVY